jgi:nucleotide-binding universal stress UspA family protein
MLQKARTVIQAIAHPTDFSPASERAFAHALCLALTTRSRLYLLHVKEPGRDDSWSSFPHVREMLARWGLMGADEPTTAIETKLGMTVVKVEIEHRDPTSGLSEFILGHRPDLLVLATQGREGLSRWLAGSVSEATARRTHVPTLFIGPEALGFVDPMSGEMRLRRVLLPIAHEPPPNHVFATLAALLDCFGTPASAIHVMHIGDTVPALETPPGLERPVVALQTGPVVDTIISTAEQLLSDLIAMPTAGRQGILDALKGSTTEQVLRRAPCPLLALPAPLAASP